MTYRINKMSEASVSQDNAMHKKSYDNESPDRHAECVSVCMDGEASDAEWALLCKTQSAQHVWSRYHLTRDAMNNELNEFCMMDISASVNAALQQEPTVLAPKSRSRTVWQTTATVALAASVFAVVISVWTPRTVNTGAADIAVDMGFASHVRESSMSETPNEQQQRLEELLISHTEAVSANGLGVMLPYARVVSDRIELPVDDATVQHSDTEIVKENVTPPKEKQNADDSQL